MSNMTPTQRAWYLITQAESQLIANNPNAVAMYTDMANAYFQIADAEELEALGVYITNSANASLPNTINVEAMSITAAAAPTDAQVLWTFGDAPIPAIVNKAVTANVATIITAAPHGLVVGQIVALSGVDATFNSVATLGSQTAYTTLSVPTPTSFTFALTTANVAAIVATGAIQVAGVKAFHTFPAAGNYMVTCLAAAGLLAPLVVSRLLHAPFVAS